MQFLQLCRAAELPVRIPIRAHCSVRWSAELGRKKSGGCNWCCWRAWWCAIVGIAAMISKMYPAKFFGTIRAFLEHLRLASMRLANVSLFHRFSEIFLSSGSMSHVPCALCLRWQLTVMGDWWRCRISALFLLLLLHFCSISAATSTFLLYFCCCFYISALFLLLLLHFFHLEEYSAARKINMLDNLN